jgi:predicted ferric reductase
MTYRGLSPRTTFIRWALFAVAVGIVLGTTLPFAVDGLIRLANSAPERFPWVATRIVAFLSYFAIAGSVIYGLLLSTKILDAIAHRPVTFALHQDLAAIGLGLGGIHAALLGLDATQPLGFVEMLVPFASSYRPLWVGVGQLGLYLVAIVTASFYVRRRIGQRAWRVLHYVTFLAFVFTTAHGVMSGTDTSAAWAWWVYVVTTTVVVFLTAYRISDSVIVRRERRGRPAVAAPGPLELRSPGRVLVSPPG